MPVFRTRLRVLRAIFSDATSFKTKRRDFFQRLRNQAEHVVKVESTPDNKLSFIFGPFD